MKEEAHLTFSITISQPFLAFLLLLSLLSNPSLPLLSNSLSLSLSLCNFGGFKVKFLKSLFSYTQQIKSSSFKLLGFLHKTPRNKKKVHFFQGTMIGPNFIDEIDCGSFFDQIDDLLDFPADDVEAGQANEDCNSLIPNLWQTQPESLPGSDSVFSTNNSASDLSAELSVPYEDIIQLEWLSNFVEDSFSGGSLTMKKEESFINKDSSHQQFQTSSPVSVLESSSSCSGEKNVPRSPETITPGRRGRARSKRPRPATFNPRLAMQLISPTSSITETPQPFLAPKVTSDSENFAESRLLIKIPKQANAEHKKKKKIKLSVPLGPVEANQNPPSQSVRKCMHCEITKTPQWRAGPMGPKTLCNACGVRYKSGRLFPEYRPAASPTFIPSLHSNSHKKVIEMRNKTGEKVVIAGKMPTMAASPELIPNANSNLALEYM